MILSNKYWRAKFSKIETLIHELIIVKNIFHAATIKNYNGAVATRNCFVQRKRKQQLRQLKKSTT